MREARRSRTTKETSVDVFVRLDGSGDADVRTGIRFLDHMLALWSFHGRADLKISAQSLDGIAHHVVEDVAIALGEAIAEALGDKRGIARYGSCLLPMDEALARVAVDFSGRPLGRVRIPLAVERIEDLDAQMVPHFFASLAQAAGVTLHVDVLEGENAHHCVEAAFKAAARAFAIAWHTDPAFAGALPSSKGVLG